ncbi:hypothetical protein DFH09DRAFT_1407031 [Mycena vulgaris]|nr:hypothetical protein DFH09DRAFT_1407031 [Mycena vulgaris]
MGDLGLQLRELAKPKASGSPLSKPTLRSALQLPHATCSHRSPTFPYSPFDASGFLGPANNVPPPVTLRKAAEIDSRRAPTCASLSCSSLPFCSCLKLNSPSKLQDSSLHMRVVSIPRSIRQRFSANVERVLKSHTRSDAGCAPSTSGPLTLSAASSRSHTNAGPTQPMTPSLPSRVPTAHPAGIIAPARTQIIVSTRYGVHSTARMSALYGVTNIYKTFLSNGGVIWRRDNERAGKRKPQRARKEPTLFEDEGGIQIFRPNDSENEHAFFATQIVASSRAKPGSPTLGVYHNVLTWRVYRKETTQSPGFIPVGTSSYSLVTIATDSQRKNPCCFNFASNQVITINATTKYQQARQINTNLHSHACSMIVQPLYIAPDINIRVGMTSGHVDHLSRVGNRAMPSRSLRSRSPSQMAVPWAERQGRTRQALLSGGDRWWNAAWKTPQKPLFSADQVPH